MKKIILRAEERDKDLYSAIDKVSDKLERQIRKNKTRMKKKVNKEVMVAFNMNFDSDNKEITDSKIVRRKSFEMKPMSEDEAILQMDLLGHDFFLYKDDKKDIMCIVYKRKDGNYGIIETN